jgi:hypothetical protein
MWATLALTAAMMAPAQASGLELTNVRPTRGIVGPPREKTEVLPGDVYFLSFDIVGLQANKEGQVRFSMGFELTHENPREGKPKVVFSQAPQRKEAILHLGGNTLPNYAIAVIGLDTPPGNYSMKVSVSDLENKNSRELTHKFKVIPLEFGFVRAGVTYETRQPAPMIFVPGQNLFLHFSLVGFTLDSKTGQPDMTIEMELTDEATGKPTLPKAFKGEVKKVEQGFDKLLPFDEIILNLNRPGSFKAVLKATDNAAKSKKTIEQTFRFKVIDPNK